MNSTGIQWTDYTWNYFSGCQKTRSRACKWCYAHKIATNPFYAQVFPNGFNLTVRPHKLNEPLKLKKPSKIFVNSMSDVFWEKVSDKLIDDIFDVMEKADWHIYQILTKRPKRMAQYIKARYTEKGLKVPSYIWLGTSIGNMDDIQFVEDLITIDAPVLWISAEPICGPIVLPENALNKLKWIVAGGESGGPGQNIMRMEPEWIRTIRDQSIKVGIPFFFKQWGSYNELGKRVGKKQAGKILDGRTWDQFPK